MLVNKYRLEIFNNECMPSAMSVQCFAHLDQDVGPALPYLNASLGGFEYIKEPPSVTFRLQGKLITVHAQKIAINALKDENEASKIVEWMIREINEAWENRNAIEPSYEGTPKPNIVDILKILPKTNCKKCGYPTCMVFATLVAEGAKDFTNCPQLGKDNKEESDGTESGYGELAEIYVKPTGRKLLSTPLERIVLAQKMQLDSICLTNFFTMNSKINYPIGE